MTQPVRAVVKWRHPAKVRAADAARLQTIASPVRGVQDRGCQVTGSMAVPTMQPTPMPAQMAPARAPAAVCRAPAATKTAATGTGHGAATPAPQPASSPAGTDSGTLMPKADPEADRGPPPRYPDRQHRRMPATRQAARRLGPASLDAPLRSSETEARPILRPRSEPHPAGGPPEDHPNGPYPCPCPPLMHAR